MKTDNSVNDYYRTKLDLKTYIKHSNVIVNTNTMANQSYTWFCEWV